MTYQHVHVEGMVQHWFGSGILQSHNLVIYADSGPHSGGWRAPADLNDHALDVRTPDFVSCFGRLVDHKVADRWRAVYVTVPPDDSAIFS
jgi:hypothetical protein